MVLPGSCCPLQGLVPLPQAAAGSLSAAAAGHSPPPLRPGAPSRRRPCFPLPFHPLLGLGLLQTGLGCALVALSFGALALSSAPQVKNACPVWAGCSAILCGILGLTTWKRPMLLLDGHMLKEIALGYCAADGEVSDMKLMKALGSLP